MKKIIVRESSNVSINFAHQAPLNYSTLACTKMKPSVYEEEIDLSELTSPPAISVKSTAETACSDGGNSQTLPEPLNELIGQIPAKLRPEVLYFFIELNHLLRYLDLIEEEIERKREMDKTVLIFRSIRVRAEALCQRVNQLAAQTLEEHKTLQEALEGIGFALRHELRKVFEEKFISQKEEEANQFFRTEITRHYSVLYNCFQQSIIVLAQVFDPMLDGKSIFEDYKVRYEQSVILYRELNLLLQKLRRVDKDAGFLQKTYFINSLKQFQQETMQFLMHRDWEEFENHVREVVETYDEMGDLVPVFLRLTIYLETLLRQVSLRNVLNETHIYTSEMTS